MEQIYDTLYATGNYNDPVATDNERKWGLIAPIFKSVVESTEIIPSAVDIGCGRGFYLRKLQSIGFSVFGVEGSRVCCDTYLQDFPEKILCYDILDYLSCEHAVTFDALCCMDVLEHLPRECMDTVLPALSKLSKEAVFGIAKHSDIMQGVELHVIQEPSSWWKEKLGACYNEVVELPIVTERFFTFYCRNLL